MVFYSFFLKMAQMRIDFTGIAVHNRTYCAVGVHNRTFYAVTKMSANKRLKRKTSAAQTYLQVETPLKRQVFCDILLSVV